MLDLSPIFCSDFVQYLAQQGHGSWQWFIVIQIMGTEHNFLKLMIISLSFISEVVYEIISILFSGYGTDMPPSPGVEYR